MIFLRKPATSSVQKVDWLKKTLSTGLMEQVETLQEAEGLKVKAQKSSCVP